MNVTERNIAAGPTRRNVFALTGALAVAGMAAAPPPNPDAALVAMGRAAVGLIEEFQRNSAAYFALPSGHPDLSRVADLNDVPSERLDEMFERANELQATTLPGLVAKAHLLRHQMRMEYAICGVVEFDSPMAEGAWGLLDDLLQMEGRA